MIMCVRNSAKTFENLTFNRWNRICWKGYNCMQSVKMIQRENNCQCTGALVRHVFSAFVLDWLLINSFRKLCWSCNGRRIIFGQRIINETQSENPNSSRKLSSSFTTTVLFKGNFCKSCTTETVLSIS